MSAVPIPITLVRWPNKTAAALLEQFIFEGRDTGRRPPRGINPEYISYWIRENIKPDCPPGAMMRVVDLLRFYERKDVLDLLSRMLTRNESDDRSFRRGMYVLQAIGELGTPEQVAFAVRYLNEFLLPLPVAMEFFPLVLETSESLAAAIDFSTVGRRLQAALDAASKVPNLSGSNGIPWRKYSDYNRNNYPVTARTIEARRRLFATDSMRRIQELLFIYMGESEFSSPSMEIWAARLLRDYAIGGGQEAVVAAFAQIFDGSQRSQMPKPRKEFLMYRAAHAIIYLQGKLTFPQEQAFDAIKDGPECFLCDDLVPPSVTP
jgi:hypothetical protein